MQALEMRFYRTLQNIYKGHSIDKDLHRKIQAAIGEYDRHLIEIQVVWPHVNVFWLSKGNSAGHSERKKKR